jgi:transketolase
VRAELSGLIAEYAEKDPRVMVLSGDHGYALFDAVRKRAPKQFLNVGVAEQAMIGFAAGLARAGYLPIAYGLAAFVPIRVLEQIKLDLCLSGLPVLLLGDGAGLVYSTLGSSHQCGEDISALRPMPGISVYSPADRWELETAFRSAMSGASGPTYIRIGKDDRKPVHSALPKSGDFSFTRKNGAKAVLVGTGSMASTALELGTELGADAISVMRIKPFPGALASALAGYEKVYVIEEHSRFGGLFSAISEELALAAPARFPRLPSISLKDRFSHKCGSHGYALSEHELTNAQIREEIAKSL